MVGRQRGQVILGVGSEIWRSQIQITHPTAVWVCSGLQITAGQWTILCFPIFHNALYLPPKFCINYCCEMLFGGLNIPKSISQQQFIQNLRGKQNLHYGELENRECAVKNRFCPVNYLDGQTFVWSFYAGKGKKLIRVSSLKVPMK